MGDGDNWRDVIMVGSIQSNKGWVMFLGVGNVDLKVIHIW